MAFDLEQSATYLASKLAKHFARSLQQRARELGFSPGQFPVLVELWAQDGLTQSQLLDRMDIEQATLANTLARMQHNGLIDRRTHPADRRARLILLTEKGRALESHAIAVAKAADDALLPGFRRFERELLMEYMRRAIETGRAD